MDAALTPVGPQEHFHLINETVEALDVDDDGLGYALTTQYEEVEPDEPCDGFCPIVYEPTSSYLWEANATTGLIDSPIAVQVLTDPEDAESWVAADECNAIDYSGGTILAACSIFSGEGDVAYIGEIDPDTARLYPDTILSGMGDEETAGFVRFEAIALDPTDGTLWGFDGEGYGAYVIDGDDTYSPGGVEMAIFAADFDRDGKLWVSAYRPESPPERVIEPGEEGLAILQLEGEDAGDFIFSAAWFDDSTFVDGLTVWGKPVLANTGSAVSPAAPAIAGLGILLLGSLLAAGTMVSRRRNAES